MKLKRPPPDVRGKERRYSITSSALLAGGAFESRVAPNYSLNLATTANRGPLAGVNQRDFAAA